MAKNNDWQSNMNLFCDLLTHSLLNVELLLVQDDIFIYSKLFAEFLQSYRLIKSLYNALTALLRYMIYRSICCNLCIVKRKSYIPTLCTSPQERSASDSEGEIALFFLFISCGGSSSYIGGRVYVIGKRSPVS
jgi:hypothetical protein